MGVEGRWSDGLELCMGNGRSSFSLEFSRHVTCDIARACSESQNINVIFMLFYNKLYVIIIFDIKNEI